MSNKITDLAKAVGVSTATISRVFSRHPYVKEELRLKILDMAKEMNYSPKFASAQNDFGIVVNGIDGITLGSFESQLISSISHTLYGKGYNADIIPMHSLKYMHSNSFKALIVISNGASAYLPLYGIPAITINCPVKGVHSIATDHFQGIEKAVDYLAGMGHERIGFIGHNSPGWGTDERERGYIETLKKHGMPFEKLLMKKGLEKQGLMENITFMIKNSATAFIVAGEGRGQLVNYAMYLLNKKIPDDISVISFEDENSSQFLTPPHTTISQNFENLGRSAAEKAIEAADGIISSDKPISVLFNNTLIERMSVRKIE